MMPTMADRFNVKSQIETVTIDLPDVAAEDTLAA